MSDGTGIEWATATWNPVVGCSPASPGCEHCYAERMAGRLAGMADAKQAKGEDPGALAAYRAVTKGTPQGRRWNGYTAEVVSAMEAPLHWRKPRVVFVVSMGDLFHISVPGAVRDAVFRVMARCPQHRFLLLTKRQRVAQRYLAGLQAAHRAGATEVVWPLANVGLGVSVCTQIEADTKLPVLLATPASMRFVSLEPMLGEVHLSRWLCGNLAARIAATATHMPRPMTTPEYLDWVIAGGETGPGAWPMHPEWARKVRDDCKDYGVPFFFKQWGEWSASETDPVRLPGFVSQAGAWSSTQLCGYGREHSGTVSIWRVGKKVAGRLLDGRTHDERPEWFGEVG